MIRACTCASVLCVKLNTPVDELYDKSPEAETNPLTSASVRSVKLNAPVDES